MLLATVIITTKNRSAELETALLSVYQQSIPLDVIVVDDGSTDNTSVLLREKFPDVHLIRHEESVGLVASRNEAASAAQTPYLVSIDDDAVFTNPETVAQAISYFDNSQVGAVAMPYINVHQSPEIRSGSPQDGVAYATFTFVGTAHAHRRELFLEIGGYRSFLRHWGEERDYCIRLYNAGYCVAISNTSPIHHFVSPKRDSVYDNQFLYRNQVLFPLINAPILHACLLVIRAVLWSIWSIIKNPRYLKSFLMAYRDVFVHLPAYLKERNSVDTDIFRLVTKLHQARHLPLDTVCQELSSICAQRDRPIERD